MVGIGATVASLLGFGTAALVISGQFGGAEQGPAGAGLPIGAAFVVAGLVGCLAGCLAILTAKAARLLPCGHDARKAEGILVPADPARPALAFAAARRHGAVP